MKADYTIMPLEGDRAVICTDGVHGVPIGFADSRPGCRGAAGRR